MMAIRCVPEMVAFRFDVLLIGLLFRDGGIGDLQFAESYEFRHFFVEKYSLESLEQRMVSTF